MNVDILVRRALALHLVFLFLPLVNAKRTASAPVKINRHWKKDFNGTAEIEAMAAQYPDVDAAIADIRSNTACGRNQAPRPIEPFRPRQRPRKVSHGKARRNLFVQNTTFHGKLRSQVSATTSRYSWSEVKYPPQPPSHKFTLVRSLWHPCEPATHPATPPLLASPLNDLPQSRLPERPRLRAGRATWVLLTEDVVGVDVLQQVSLIPAAIAAERFPWES